METKTEVEQRERKEVLIIDPPNELLFTGPFNRPVITKLKLSNPTNHTVCYKIKTTAPKRYCVRPNFGVIGPNIFNIVEICLQPFTYDPNEKNKHKFMVQSLIAPDDCYDFQQLWKDATPDQLMDAKLRCVFEMPVSGANENIVGTAAVGVQPADVKEVAAKATVANVSDEKLTNLPPTSPPEWLPKEMRQLEEEVRELRKENHLLKKQLMVLKVSESDPPVNEHYAPLAEKQIPIFYIVMAVFAILVGLVLGKYLL